MPICFSTARRSISRSAKNISSSRPTGCSRRRGPAGRRFLQFGVGAVRDAGDKDGVGLALAAEAKTQHGQARDDAWIDSPGAAIHHRGRYGSFMGEPIEDHATPADCVAARVAAGADRIKLLVSGIINFKVGPRHVAAADVGRRSGRDRRSRARAVCDRPLPMPPGTDGVENAIAGRRHDGRARLLRHARATRAGCATGRSPGCRRSRRCSCRSIAPTNWAGTHEVVEPPASESSTAIERCCAKPTNRRARSWPAATPARAACRMGWDCSTSLVHMERAGSLADGGDQVRPRA